MTKPNADTHYLYEERSPFNGTSTPRQFYQQDQIRYTAYSVSSLTSIIKEDPKRFSAMILEIAHVIFKEDYERARKPKGFSKTDYYYTEYDLSRFLIARLEELASNPSACLPMLEQQNSYSTNNNVIR